MFECCGAMEGQEQPLLRFFVVYTEMKQQGGGTSLDYKNNNEELTARNNRLVHSLFVGYVPVKCCGDAWGFWCFITVS
jgi:hypothetical protein